MFVVIGSVGHYKDVVASSSEWKPPDSHATRNLSQLDPREVDTSSLPQRKASTLDDGDGGVDVLGAGRALGFVAEALPGYKLSQARPPSDVVRLEIREKKSCEHLDDSSFCIYSDSLLGPGLVTLDLVNGEGIS